MRKQTPLGGSKFEKISNLRENGLSSRGIFLLQCEETSDVSYAKIKINFQLCELDSISKGL